MSLFSSNDEYYCTPFALHNSRIGQIENTRLEPENEYGNVEYKLRLTDPTPERIERLVTQLKWRIREGHGEAIVYLGVKDNGQFVGLTPEEIKLSLQTLEQMSTKIGAKMAVVNERIVEQTNLIAESSGQQNNSSSSICGLKNLKSCRKTPSNKYNSGKSVQSKHKENSFSQTNAISNNNNNNNNNNATNPNDKLNHYFNNNVDNNNKLKKSSNYQAALNKKQQPVRKVIQVLVKRKTHDISEELRVAVLGPTESGKSSLLGVLSRGTYDNGRGSARLNLFRHRHEIRSGHTSSISQEIFGFDSDGKPLTYNTCFTTEEIVESSTRIVTLIDLAGHQRYLSTTLFGLGSHAPDFVILVVSAISPITNMTTDYITLTFGMEKSLAIVINKIDLASKEDQENCYYDIVEALQELHPNITPQKILTLEDAIVAGSRNFSLNEKNTYLPIFFTSCVTGVGLNCLYAFFNEVSPNVLNSSELNQAVSQSSEIQVDETFEIIGIGTVVSGLMVEGIIREGDEMLLGPDDQGNFSVVSVVSLQRHKIPCNFARAGQKCTMAIMGKDSKVKVRKGMVMKELVNDWNQSFSICLQFQACVKFITNKQLKLNRGGEVSVYVGNVKQTCIILSISQQSSTSNNCSSCLVDLKLTKRPEYIREGSKLIIRYASTKGIGTVTRIVPITKKLSN